MKKYEEEHYLFENIKEQIYPWITQSLVEPQALNGKMISEKDTPLISFVGDLMVLFVIKRGEETYEIIKDNMLPPDCDIEMLYRIACENLVRDVEFVIGNTMYGAFAILADGFHEASSLCFRHIWNVCVDKLKDDLLIMVPSKDVVLFAPASQETVVEKMKMHGEQAYAAANRNQISTGLFLFTQDGKELLAYDETKH
ncbi:MAG: hypothetical protein Q4C52_12335 [Eubacteriales bacterium]|nr:hypothetical protein [Eubacteriales bacterium]